MANSNSSLWTAFVLPNTNELLTYNEHVALLGTVIPINIRINGLDYKNLKMRNLFSISSEMLKIKQLSYLSTNDH